MVVTFLKPLSLIDYVKKRLQWINHGMFRAHHLWGLLWEAWERFLTAVTIQEFCGVLNLRRFVHTNKDIKNLVKIVKLKEELWNEVYNNTIHLPTKET